MVLPKPLISSLREIPTHLLAAVYASALPFASHDPHLCVQNVYDKPSENQIWHIALEDISREIQAPRLSVLQAGLLYLQKARRGSEAAADTPFKWSFMAFLVGLATSLGLHLDCRDWLIPPWEKRLRRRLWWLVYTEEKWRCLLLGRPSLIGPEQWDVSELDDEDFVTEDDLAALVPEQPAWWPPTHVEQCTHFRYLSRLAQTADDIYRAFYTLRASRRLATDFASSLKAAKPLREQLRNWYSSLPPPLQMRNKSEKAPTAGVTMDATAALHFAYLSLEVLLYRALLRPLGPPSKKDAHAANPPGSGGGVAPTVETTRQVDRKPIDGGSADDMLAARVATRTAAHNCAKLVVSFTAGLDSLDFGAFWYSWSRIGFPLVTSFVALLVVQAPTPDLRADAMSIANSWRDTLRVQSKSFDQMRLGLLRLDVMYWIGFDELFSM
ncbi:hypothetical protein A1O1_05735 [Capronia coronata CBS 617.96]|uniref:Xylanolytic transcriptional activator regulatory domain-containing protein n=1 Tax=Capronia coronata CBS 617.96 TaxID=1182541 RepID=W9Y827_9EURO|nr:uncharacterized protein A1O1_05735 [Capronia coronata CBS 617.96]EXJ85371.1 hypothetical protein A1O1_05735 [Capronia coronata CBS 617.96]